MREGVVGLTAAKQQQQQPTRARTFAASAKQHSTASVRVRTHLQQVRRDGVARLGRDEVAARSLEARRPWRAKLGLEDVVKTAVTQLTQRRPAARVQRQR